MSRINDHGYDTPLFSWAILGSSVAYFLGRRSGKQQRDRLAVFGQERWGIATPRSLPRPGLQPKKWWKQRPMLSVRYGANGPFTRCGALV